MAADNCYDVFVSEDGETGQPYQSYNDLSSAIAHAAALFVSGAYKRVTIYFLDEHLKSWTR